MLSARAAGPVPNRPWYCGVSGGLEKMYSEKVLSEGHALLIWVLFCAMQLLISLTAASVQ